MEKKNELCLGIDIGGTSAKYGLVDGKGQITLKNTFLTGKDMTAQEFLAEIRRMCAWAKENGASGAGVSCLGFIDSENGIITGGVENMPFLEGVNLKAPLVEFFDESRVAVNNDGDCFALGEGWLGNASGCRNYFCMALGTGIGGSLVVNGSLVKGAHFRAGEIGYLDYTDDDHYFERSCSTQTLLARYAAEIGCESVTGFDWIAKVKEDDPIACRYFSEWMEDLSKVLANVILLLDVEKVIIGGGISKQSALMQPRLEACVKKRLPEYMRDEVVVDFAKYANDSAIIGAVAPVLSV